MGLGEHHFDLLGQGLVVSAFTAGQHPADVVGVDHGDAALAFANGLHLRRVLGEEFLGDVVGHATNPFRRCRFTTQDDLVSNKRLVVGALAVAQAELAFQRRVGQIGIGFDAGRIDDGGVDDRNTRPARQGVPLALRVSQVGRTSLCSVGEVLGRKRPSFEAFSNRAASTKTNTSAGLLSPFALQAFEKHFVFGFQHLDGDAGILSFELAIELFVRVVVTGRIHTKSDLLLGVGGLMRGLRTKPEVASPLRARTEMGRTRFKLKLKAIGNVISAEMPSRLK